MSKDISKLIVKVEDEATWLNLIEQSQNKLIIVDCHQDWCGPCEAMNPTFTRIFIDYEVAEERLVLATLAIGKMGSTAQASFPHDCHISLEKNGCIPVFAFYRFKACLSVINGVDAPAVVQQVSLNIPDKPLKENLD